MKELSIEEKAYDGNYKAYTELINRLEDVKNAIKKQNYGIAIDVLCKPYPEFQVTIHSELKESEDERIRKELIFYLRYQHSISENFEDIGKWIAWLEKQGEQKPVKFKPLFKFGDIIKPKDPALGEPRIIKGIYPKFGYDTNNGILDFEFEDNWELVEQKPAWSEEDKRIIDNLISQLGNLYTRKLIKEETKDKYVNWLKSLKDRYTWKPSDEQMERLKGTINSLPHKEVLYSLYQDLKKLRGE